ncbi:hypothetical protein [Lactococcus lactis]|uniref:hypothetical protein n=1 Tax=Lactococcus lactis TaxID=1358 RepID=UPI001911DC9B|nr:hypothetical protein [Lactococcus lactis]WDA67430.1 hypothetical protein IL310_01295 [Lactococcus lactis]WDA67499.1 hypothetical protein IL310_01080 [Lactococcus lactis]
MKIKYTNFIQTWQIAKSLKIKLYLKLVPIWWWGLAIFITVQFLITSSFKVSIFWLISQILIYFFLYINTVFYPWFKLFASKFYITHSLFPNYRDKIVLFYEKFGQKTEVYTEIKTKPHSSVPTCLSNGQFYTSKKYYAKNVNNLDTLILLPIFRFFLLNIFGIFSFIFGWIFVPWCFKRYYSRNKQNKHKSY